MKKGSKRVDIPIRDTPRSSDDDVLEMLSMRARNTSWASIAAHFGKSSYQGSQTLCRNVLIHDIEYSGEPEEEIRKCY